VQFEFNGLQFLNAPKHIDMSTDKNFLVYVDHRLLLDVNSMDLRCSGCHGYYSSLSGVHTYIHTYTHTYLLTYAM